LVSSTEPASARNSRERDNASRITLESSQAIAIQHDRDHDGDEIPTLAGSLSPSPDRLLRKAAVEPQAEEHLGENAIAPAMITAMTSMRTSPLRICVSS